MMVLTRLVLVSLVLSLVSASSQWMLVYRLCNGAEPDATDLLLNSTEGSRQPLILNETCARNEKSYLMNVWEDIDVETVRLSIYKANVEVAYVVFDAKCSESTNWFTSENIKESSFTDIYSTKEKMRLYNLDDGAMFSMIYKENTTDCSQSIGWLTVLTKSTTCPAMSATSFPTIYFSNTYTMAQFDDTVQMETADSLAIWVRLRTPTGQRQDVAKHLEINLGNSQCLLEGMDIVSGFAVNQYDQAYCTKVSCSGDTWIYLDLGVQKTVGAVNINPVSSGTNKSYSLSSRTSQLSNNNVVLTVPLGSSLTVHSVELDGNANLGGFAIRIGGEDANDIFNPICHYQKDAIALSGSTFVCTTWMTGTHLHIVKYNETDTTTLSSLSSLQVYNIPDLEIHVLNELVSMVNNIDSHTLCGVFPVDVTMSTIYCNMTSPGRYVAILTRSQSEFAFCDLQVFQAELTWQHPVVDFCLESQSSAVDMSENITLIPNPERPLSADGLIVGWQFEVNLTNYGDGQSAIVHLQLWRAPSSGTSTDGTTTTLQLVGQTKVTVDRSGLHDIDLRDSGTLEARKGDLIGLAMPGYGSLVYYRNISSPMCVFVGDNRTGQWMVNDLLNFSSVWLDDWTYKLTAVLAPKDEDGSWVRISTNDQHCLGHTLEFMDCYNDTEIFVSSLLWKLENSGLLINQETFGCLDVSPYKSTYMLALSDCYNVSWGEWQFDNDGKLKNVILGRCIKYSPNCDPTGVTNCFLVACADGSELLLVPYYIHGSQSHGCYYSQPELDVRTAQLQADGDPLNSCMELCISSSNKTMFSIFNNECACHNTSLEYIALPNAYCDKPCYGQPPFDLLPTCGTFDTSKVHRSVYLSAELCRIEPNTWTSSVTECTFDGVEIGTTCPVTCVEGYNFSSAMNSVSLSSVTYNSKQAYANGYVDVTCLSSRTWSLAENQTCERIICPLENDSSVTPTRFSNKYQDWELYRCRVGYVNVSGVSNVTCTANGTWDEQPLKCTIVKCPVLEKPAGVQVIDNYTNTDVIDWQPNKTGIAYKSWIQYGCQSAYRNLSDVPVTLTCQTDGRWSSAIPDCELIDCHAPPTVANAESSYQSTYYLQNVTYSCKYGFEHTAGDLVRYCTYDGTWNATAPTCTEILCSSPPSKENTTMSLSGDGFSIGSVVNYTCSYGYKSTDPSIEVAQSECQISRNWVNLTQPLTCIEIECSTPPNINFTLLNKTGNKLDDSAVYRPKIGYQISIGVIKVTCSLSGVWVTPEGDELTEQTAGNLAIVEEITCEDPPVLPNTVMSGSGNSYNSERVYTCNTSVSGSATSRCSLDMTWTPVNLDCEVKCPSPTTNISLGDGVILKDVDPDATYLIKSTLTIACAPGYTYVSGSGMYTCTDQGTWQDSGSGPRVCKELQCEIPTVEEGMECTPATGGVHVNSTLECNCITNRTIYLSGNTTRTCLATGLLTGSALSCQTITCPSVSDVGVLKVSPQGYAPGEKCMFLCSDDYVLHPDDPDEMECLGTGQWALDETRYPRCIDPYASILPDKTGNGTSENTTVPWMIIKDGEDPNIIGTNTSGVTRLPFYGGCDPPEILENAFGTVVNDSGRFRVIYECMNGYNMSTTESPEMKCSLRQWIGPAFECLPFIFCPLPDTGKFSTLKSGESELFSPGSEIYYSCEEGYFAEDGDAKRVCRTDGTWSGTALNCMEQPCPEPPTVKYASYEIDKYSYGRYCIYKCFPGYKHVSGDLYKNCSSLGIWVGKNPVCEVSTEPDQTSLEYIEAMIRSNMSETMIVLEKFGFTEADFTPTSQSIGGFEVIFLVFVVVFFVGTDIPDLRREFKHRLRPNLRSCLGK